MRCVSDWSDSDRKSTRLNSSHLVISYAVFCLKKKKLALDCGPGWTVKAAITVARTREPRHIALLEDRITGDYTPYPNVFFLMIRPPPRSPLFPYATLFR